MTKTDLENYLAARGGLDISDPQVKALVETARMMVLSADGRHIWQNLKVKTTLAIVAGTAQYTFLPDGSDDPPISKLTYVKGQADTDRPIKIYTDEEAAETDFSTGLTGIVLYPHDEDGKIKLLFKPTPTAAATYDVGYRKAPPDDLGFVLFPVV